MQIEKSIISACILPAQKWSSATAAAREIKERAESGASGDVWINSWERAAPAVCIFPVCAAYVRRGDEWCVAHRFAINPAITSNAAGHTIYRPPMLNPFFACWSPPLKSGDRKPTLLLCCGSDNCIPSAIMCCDARPLFAVAVICCDRERQNASKLLPRHCVLSPLNGLAIRKLMPNSLFVCPFKINLPRGECCII